MPVGWRATSNGWPSARGNRPEHPHPRLALLEAERTWIALRQDYLDTLFDLRVALLEVARATGTPESGA